MMKALYTWPSEPMIKLTRTFISSSSGCSNGSGVSKASGGRTSPHFARASGADTGENSEMCAGTWRRVFSNCVSGVRCGMSGDRDVTAHQARATLRPASGTAAVSAFQFVLALVLGQTHCITMEWAIWLPATARTNTLIIHRLTALLLRLFQRQVQSVAKESHRTAIESRFSRFQGNLETKSFVRLASLVVQVF